MNRCTPVTPHRLPGVKATLTWEDNGVIYSVTSVLNALPKDKLLRFAESLGK